MTSTPAFRLNKLWIYTNYDCNLRCTYCVAESSPQAARQGMDLETVRRLVDEAEQLGFEQVYFTGGEPLLLPEIDAMLAYASARLETTLLTNGMLARGRRLEKLCAIRGPRLIIQVSLDGSTAEVNDASRGAGSWVRTVEGLGNLLEKGFHVRLASTETEANRERLDELCDYHLTLGIPEEDHLIRPLVRRGFSEQGKEVGKYNLAPELTVNRDGVYWHPLSKDVDFLVSAQIFPLARVVDCMLAELGSPASGTYEERQTFK